MVEHKAFSQALIKSPNQDECVGRIRGMNNIEALPDAHPKCKERNRRHRVGILVHVTENTAGWRRCRKAVHIHPVDPLMQLLLRLRWADDRNLIASIA